jgi:hypothetical protein
VKILPKEKRLYDGGEKEKYCVHVTFPGFFVILNVSNQTAADAKILELYNAFSKQ